ERRLSGRLRLRGSLATGGFGFLPGCLGLYRALARSRLLRRRDFRGGGLRLYLNLLALQGILGCVVKCANFPVTIAVLVDLEDGREQLLRRQGFDRELQGFRAGIEAMVAHGPCTARASAGKKLRRRAIIESRHLKPRKTMGYPPLYGAQRGKK